MQEKLTEKELKKIIPPAKLSKKYFDSATPGLYLEVYANGKYKWRVKVVAQGIDKRITIGDYPDMSLQQARKTTLVKQKDIKKNPEVIKNKKMILKQIALTWIEKEETKWCPKYAIKIKRLVTRYVIKYLGHKFPEEISAPEFIQVCKKAEVSSSTYVSHVVLSIMTRIMSYAVACGHTKYNPCRDILPALTPYKVRHYAAITDPPKIGALLRQIDGYPQPIVRSAMQMLALTLVRTGELRFSTWDEFYLDEALWRIPAERMKMKREHVVPLSTQAVTVMRNLHLITGDAIYPFKGRTDTRPISDNTVNAALRYMGYSGTDMVGHGFRSMGSTLLNELQYNPDHIERQLAHAPNNKIRATYNRAAYLPERKKMMQEWADYLDMLKSNPNHPPKS